MSKKKKKRKPPKSKTPTKAKEVINTGTQSAVQEKSEKETIEKVEEKTVKKSQLPKKKISKWIWIFLVSFLISVLGSIWGYRFLTKSVPSDFSAKFSQVGNIEFSYGEKQSEKISPLCGCKNVGEWENWRGITFTARDIEIHRKGDLPVTGYLIFSPYPQQTIFSPIDGFKMKTTYYLIEIDEYERFDPKFLISGKFPSNYKLIRKGEDTDEGFVQIFSEGKLNISLLGNKPLGSWIGMEKSNISINYQSGQKATEPTSAIIKEKYLKSTEKELNQVWNERGYYDQSRMAMPLGDFLGPNVVLWNEDETTTILASSGVIDTPKSKPIGKRFIKVVVVNPPFAVRIVTFAFGKDDTSDLANDPTEKKEKKFSFLGSQGRFDNGEVSIIINNPDKQAKEFEQIYQSMKEKETTDSAFKTYNSNEIAGGIMTFRYPPIPPNNGFNIFGKINKLRISLALGNLLIGSRSYNIEAPADFELRDIKEMDVKNGVIEIPLQIGMDEIPSKIQLKANSEIYVNNESITRRMDNNKTTYEYFILILTFISAIVTFLSLVATVISLRK